MPTECYRQGMQRPSIALLVLACVVVACGGSHEPEDLDAALSDDGGGVDAPLAPPDASSCTTPMTDGCACGDPGLTICTGGRGTQCCGGRWQSFWDGPCWSSPDDGGMSSCDTPDEGCPCPTEGEIACRFTQWRLVCTSGAWRADYGRVCC